MTVYLTRDRDEEGMLLPFVDVWLSEPKRTANRRLKHGNHKGAAESCGGFWQGDDWTGDLDLSVAETRYGIVPASDRFAHKVDL